MPVSRGDVILAYVPNVGSPGGKEAEKKRAEADKQFNAVLTKLGCGGWRNG